MGDFDVGAFEEVKTASSSIINVHNDMPSKSPPPSGDIRAQPHVPPEVHHANLSGHMSGTTMSQILVDVKSYHEVSIGATFPRLRIGGVLVKSQRSRCSKLRGPKKESRLLRCRQQKENCVLLSVPDHMHAKISVKTEMAQWPVPAVPDPPTFPDSDTMFQSAADESHPSHSVLALEPTRDFLTIPAAFEKLTTSPASPKVNGYELPHEPKPKFSECVSYSSKPIPVLASTPNRIRSRSAPCHFQDSREVVVMLTENSKLGRDPAEDANGQSLSLNRIHVRKERDVSEQDGYLADISNNVSATGDEPMAMDYFECEATQLGMQSLNQLESFSC